MVNTSTNKSIYEQRLNKIKKSIKVGDYINASTQHYKKILKVTNIDKLDEPIPNRSNITLHITAKPIDINTFDRPDKIFHVADLLQFALINESS